MKRRSFLKTTAAATASAPLVVGGLKAQATSSLKMLAQLPADSDRTLVVIQLFGGNDGLNTLVPAEDDAYYNLRPAVHVPKELAWNGVGDIYLHPALASGAHGGMATMLEVGNLAIVQGVGYDNPNLSHFRSTDIWLSGINDSNPNRRLDTGWIGRFLENRFPSFPDDLPDDPLAIQFGGFSLLLRGSNGKKMGIEINDPTGQAGVVSAIDELDANAPGTPYLDEYTFIADIAQRSNKYAERVKSAYETGEAQLAGTYDEDSLGSQMRAVAAMIAGGLDTKVYVVSMGGFDTHVNQQQVDGESLIGNHPLLLGRLSRAISEFQFDMIRLDQADRVVGMTLSEFGRRARENGSLGTDHGAASVQFVFGTNVNSAVFGETPDLSDLNSNGDLRSQIDYRSVYMELLTDWFGLDAADSRTILEDDDLLPLDVLKEPSSVGNRENRSGGAALLGARPNPFTESMSVEFRTTVAGPVRVALFSPDGRVAATLVEQNLPAGTHKAPFNGTLPNGRYLLRLETPSGADTRMVTCLRGL